MPLLKVKDLGDLARVLANARNCSSLKVPLILSAHKMERRSFGLPLEA